MTRRTDRRLFIDLDGVLADFDRGYENAFGVKAPPRTNRAPKDFWKLIKSDPTFFRRLPLMPDALALWEGAKKLHPNPIILTGLTHVASDVTEAAKRAWVAEHISPLARVIV